MQTRPCIGVVKHWIYYRDVVGFPLPILSLGQDIIRDLARRKYHRPFMHSLVGMGIVLSRVKCRMDEVVSWLYIYKDVTEYEWFTFWIVVFEFELTTQGKSFIAQDSQ